MKMIGIVQSAAASFALEIETAQSGQAHVQHEAGWPVRTLEC